MSLNSFLIIPMILLHLFILFFMRWLKSSLESKVSPRYFWAEADSILLLVKVKVLFMWEANVCIVFGSARIKKYFPLICPLANQLQIFIRFNFRFFFLLIDFKESDVSSANILQSEVIHQVNQLYILNVWKYSCYIKWWIIIEFYVNFMSDW